MTDGITGTEGDVPGLGDVSDAPKGPGPSQSAPWLKMIADAEKVYRDYQTRSDNIDKQYANLERLASGTRDREIQLFWANISVMAPSTYSRPPVPVVVPRFKVDAELPRVASEMLERATIVTFERENVDGEMRLIRDDLVILARGAAWLRLSSEGGTERVCIDHADRKDWLCEPARKWKDVDWVARRAWLTEPEAKKRFFKYSGDAYKSLAYSVRKDAEADANDGASKAGIWELWSKSANKVVWVSEGAAVCLDEGPPHLKLEGFFPCPRPAFGTVERRSLVPVPDFLFYKDQLEEINEITARIAALSEAVRVRGFYPSGAGDVSTAIEKAAKSTSNNTLLIPISNIAMVGNGGVKDMIVWWPIEAIAATITAIIAIRKQLIEDVYEVTGLSDIMRGQTEASETLGAQQLKSQYGSVRIKDRQDELTRVARDLTRLAAEIMAENFSGETLMQMAQMPLPSAADVEQKAAPLRATLEQIAKELPALQAELQSLQAEVQHAAQDPETQAMAKANPEQAQAVLGQVQQKLQADQAKAQALQQAGQQAGQQASEALQTLEATVTIDKVVALLRAEKLRPFILDIETDSTITPDENAAKQRATEFVTAVGGYMKNALPLVETMPQSAAMVAETLKFITNQYRAGRELQGVIDKFADQMKAKAEQPPQPSPEAIKAQADAKAAEAKQQQDAQTAAADNAAKGATAAKEQADAQATTLEADTKAKDADLARRVAEQEAADASELRTTEAKVALLDAQTKAADAELQRRVTEQQEFDAARARDLEIAAKKALGELAIVAAREKHAQEMAKGEQAMEIAAAKAERDQKVADAAIVAHEATAAAAASAKPGAK